MSIEKDEKGLLMQEDLYARLYFHLASAYLRTFKKNGEMALRKAVRKYGADRGKRMRAEHEACGHAIDLKTLFTIGGFPGTAGFKNQIVEIKPDRCIYETLTCPLYNWWKELGGEQEALINCEEIHGAMWSAYHPNIESHQPKRMPRGDGLCRFEVFLPSLKGAAETEKYPQIDFQKRLQQLTDIQAIMYYYLAKGICEEFGLEGEAALRQGIRTFGRERGLDLRKQHMAQGLEINLYNLFTHTDLPTDERFSRNKIELTPETRLSETLVCSIYDMWKEYPDGNHFGRMYCEEVHHAKFGAYDEAVQVNLCRTLTQGDERCVFSLYLRPANRILPSH